MKTSALLPIALVVTLGLAGCSSIFGHGRSSMASASRTDVEDIYREFATDQLELGRLKIRQGALTEALDPLRRASFNPATAAAAHNAMGVVYAKLGRKDVAERMFRLAISQDPAEPKFAANLERLEASGATAPSPAAASAAPMQASNVNALPPAAALPAIAVSAAPLQAAKPEQAVHILRPAFGSAVQVSQPVGPIQRLSQYEVRVGGSTAPARTARVRQAYAGDLPTYPQRFRIDVSSPGAAGAARSAAYPARVSF